jgi:hypothetical protein
MYTRAVPLTFIGIILALNGCASSLRSTPPVVSRPVLVPVASTDSARLADTMRAMIVLGQAMRSGARQLLRCYTARATTTPDSVGKFAMVATAYSSAENSISGCHPALGDTSLIAVGGYHYHDASPPRCRWFRALRVGAYDLRPAGDWNQVALGSDVPVAHGGPFMPGDGHRRPDPI